MTYERLKKAILGMPRWDVELGGCGDPECCGTSIDSFITQGGPYIRYEDIVTLIDELEET